MRDKYHFSNKNKEVIEMDEYHRTIKEFEIDRLTKEIESMEKEIIYLKRLLTNISKIKSDWNGCRKVFG